MPLLWLRKTALRLGRRRARQVRLPLVRIYADTLAGDLERFAVLRVMRRTYPKEAFQRLVLAVEKELAP